jgi:hypothetical protein
MSFKEIVVYCPCVKSYTIKKIPHNGSVYNGDVSGIVAWYYTNINNVADFVTLNVYGTLHQTYPNPGHLSVEISTPEGQNTGRLHFSLGQQGWYQQPLAFGKKRKRTRKQKRKKRKH